MIKPAMNRIVLKIEPDKSFARYSFLFGIFRLIVCTSAFREGMFDGFLLGVMAITLSRVSKKDGKRRASAKAGLIFGILSVVLSCFLYYGFSAFYTFAHDPVAGPQFLSMMEELFSAYGMSLEDFLHLLRGR